MTWEWSMDTRYVSRDPPFLYNQQHPSQTLVIVDVFKQFSIVKVSENHNFEKGFFNCFRNKDTMLTWKMSNQVLNLTLTFSDSWLDLAAVLGC